jgi:hypothetical protein
VTDSSTDAVPPAPRAPRCTVHPDLDAVAACSSCGNPMCATCAAGGGDPVCATCAVQLGVRGFPYSRDSFTVDGLFNVALSRFKAHWELLCVLGAAFFLIAYGLPFVGKIGLGMLRHSAAGGFVKPSSGLGWDAISSIADVLGSLLQLGCQVVLLGICLDLLERRPLDVTSALSRLERMPALFGALVILVAGFSALALGASTLVPVALSYVSEHRNTLGPMPWVIAAGMLLCMFPPAVFLGVSFSFVLPELAHQPDATLLSACRSSWQLVSGRRWLVLGIEIAIFMVALSGMLVCGLGLVATLPLSTLLFASLFLALKNPGAGRDFASSTEHAL